MDTRRYSNMMAAYDGHTGPVTVGAVLLASRPLRSPASGRGGE